MLILSLTRRTALTRLSLREGGARAGSRWLLRTFGPNSAGKRRSMSSRHYGKTRTEFITRLRWPGGYGGVAAPDPIPNSAVKRPSADGTPS